jgi:hypothetical protein
VSKKIDVTQTDIDNASDTEADLFRCPIDHAATRAFGREVLATNTRLLGDRGRVVAILPEVARDFVLRFDRHQKVEPIVFEVDVNE